MTNSTDPTGVYHCGEIAEYIMILSLNMVNRNTKKLMNTHQFF